MTTTATEIKERPILFSTPMVQAIVDGTKTQTRRVVKHGLSDSTMSKPDIKASITDNGQMVHFKVVDGKLRESFCGIKCPYGQIGDRLWVREAWDYSDSLEEPYLYRQKEMEEWLPEVFNRMKWKPSIHMPKEACRIKLEIPNIRVERLHDITEEDAIAEGVLWVDAVPGGFSGWKDYSGKNLAPLESAKVSFKTLWISINGKESWDANPWVWVVDFKKTDQSN
ncbi:hypothetical protein [Pontibacter sp. H249]|uniref:hypothetical protein n=1 Tax=Pontibacter sp. H249 TaxID=3133420 RepID=UPI0030C5AE29